MLLTLYIKSQMDFTQLLTLTFLNGFKGKGDREDTVASKVRMFWTTSFI